MGPFWGLRCWFLFLSIYIPKSKFKNDFGYIITATFQNYSLYFGNAVLKWGEFLLYINVILIQSSFILGYGHITDTRNIQLTYMSKLYVDLLRSSLEMEVYRMWIMGVPCIIFCSIVNACGSGFSFFGQGFVKREAQKLKMFQNVLFIN